MAVREGGFKAEKVSIANRLRKIRMSAGLTQEQFAELLDVSLSAYKKIESSENQISINGLRKIVTELNVSADYVLFGKYENFEDTWKMVMNCSEDDKLFLLFRLINYFTTVKEGKYCDHKDQAKYDGNILSYFEKGLAKDNK